MSGQDLCANCHHARASHKNDLGESGTACSWPNCNCKQFVELDWSNRNKLSISILLVQE